jgi:hypothetical protein
MKNAQKRTNSLFSVCICLKLNKFIRTAPLLAVMLGVFLLPKTAQMAAITPEKILELTNRERTSVRLIPLKTNGQLTAAAQAKVEAILVSQIFDHTINNRRFSAWIKDSGYKYSLAGENLAIDFITSEGVVKAWMASRDHRENLFGQEYTDTGIAAIEGKFSGQNTIIVAQIFGAPLYKTPPIPENISRLNEQLNPLDRNISFENEQMALYYKMLNKFFF